MQRLTVLRLRLFVFLFLLGIALFYSPSTIAEASSQRPIALSSSVSYRSVWQANSAFCAAVTDVPASECLALLDLFDDTNGNNWISNNGWFIDSAVCSWYGVTCAVGHITELDLRANGLNGTIPHTLNELSQLQLLYMHQNILTGSIPANLGTITTLIGLDLSENQLSGTVPASLGNLTNVTWLSITTNQLSGGIPSELGNLSSIQVLRLNHNQLTGTIPVAFGNLSNLQWLDLGHNHLIGTIPASMGIATALTDLFLYENQLSGTIPTTLGNLSSLVNLGLNYNQLSGSIPIEFGNLVSLEKMVLSDNHLTGAIPSQLGNLSNLDRLWLFNNSLEGSIPGTLGNLPKLKELILSDNNLSGSIPANLGNLQQIQHIRFSYNQLSGTIPIELGNLDSIAILLLDHNLLTGTIPAQLGNLSSLTWIDLGHNQLIGSIPDSFGNLMALTDLFLYENQLSGSISTQLDNLSNLVNLGLAFNHLDGSIPSVIGTLSQLQKIDLSHNKFSDEIPSELGNLTNLDRLWLNDNLLSGQISPYFGDLTNLVEFKVNTNSLSGSLPTQLTQLSALQQLWFDNTTLCEPQLQSFQNWLDSIVDLHTTELGCLNKFSLSKSASAEEVTSNATVTINVSVATEIDATSLVTDRIPVGLTYVSSSATGGVVYDATKRVLMYNGTISAQNPLQFSYQVTVDATNMPGAILNIPTTVDGIDSEENSASITLYIPKSVGINTLVLIYVVGDNDLGPEAIRLINNAEKATGNDPSVATVLLLDGPGNGGAYLYYLQSDNEDLSCPNYQNISCNGRYQFGVDLFEWTETTASVDSLKNFIVQAQNAHPTAQRVILSLVGHGSGWSPDLLPGQPRGISDQPRGISDQPEGGLLWDQNAAGDNSLSTSELRRALTLAEQVTQRRIGLLYLDACSMAMVEVAYELSGVADYLLASESTSWASFVYDELLTAVTGNATALEIGEQWLEIESSVLDAYGDYYPYTYSLINLNQIGNLAQASKTLVTALQNAFLVASTTAPETGLTRDELDERLAQVAISATCFDTNYDGKINLVDTYCDLGTVVAQIRLQFADYTEIFNAASAVNDLLHTTVTKANYRSGRPWSPPAADRQEYSSEHLAGLSIYLPLAPRMDDVLRRFYTGNHLRYVAETDWDLFLDSAWAGAEPPTMTVDCDCANAVKPAPLQPMIRVQPVATVAQPGETVSINVELRNMPIQQAFGGAQLRINYAPASLQATSCTNPLSSLFELYLCNVEDAGTAQLAIGTSSGVMSDTVVAQIEFQVTGEAGDTSPITLYIDKLYDAFGQTLTAQAMSGVISVGEGSGQLLGDVDCNGSRDIQDAIQILHFDNGLVEGSNQCPPPSETIYTPVCDVNGDTECNMGDALYVAQCTVGIDNVLCPNVTASSQQVDAMISAPTPLGNVRVYFGEIQQYADGTFKVPVLADVADASVGAATAEFHYDHSQFEIIDCSVNISTGFDLASCNTRYGKNTTIEDSVKFSLVDSQGASGSIQATRILLRPLHENVTAQELANTFSLQSVAILNTVGEPIPYIISLSRTIYLPMISR